MDIRGYIATQPFSAIMGFRKRGLVSDAGRLDVVIVAASVGYDVRAGVVISPSSGVGHYGQLVLEPF